MTARFPSRNPSLPPTSPSDDEVEPQDVVLGLWANASSFALVRDGARIIVGRDGDACDLFVDDPSVSQQHARIDVQGHKRTIVDLGSTNGTLVRGRRLEPHVPVPLEEGQFVQVGRATVVLQLGWTANLFPLGRRVVPKPASGDQPAVGPNASIQLMIEKVARTNLSVLIRGETGAGKEITAHAIHVASGRRGRYVALNCAALDGPLLLSEIFGHEKGAFTGAVATKPGLLETADDGTGVLDEVGDAGPQVQSALLRFMEDGTFMRVGSTQIRQSRARIIAATHRDLLAMVKAGTFREDLYYRLRGCIIHVPPLRERVDEILPLALRFLAKTGRRLKLSRAAERALLAHPWPGNVRELKQTINRAAAFAGGPIVTPDDLDLQVIERFSEEERQRVTKMFFDCQFNRTLTAARLGMARGTLNARLKAFGLIRKDSK